MTIEYRNVSELVPYVGNPRDNTDAVDKVAESIRQFGFKVPIVVDRNDVIVTGHTRLAAAKLLGMEQVPTIRADDLSEEQVKAFRIADNSTGELAGWDFAELEREVESIERDMSVFGFEKQNAFDFVDDLFKTDDKEEPSEIQCPYCGEWFVP